MRTNVVIDDRLAAEAMQLTGIKTKRELVESSAPAGAARAPTCSAGSGGNRCLGGEPGGAACVRLLTV